MPTMTHSGAKVWLVTGYRDVRAGLSDPRLSRDTRAAAYVIDGGGIDGQALRALPLELADPLLRTESANRLRRLAAAVFTPERVERLRPRITELAGRLLAPLRHQRSVDLVAEVARPLPTLLTCGLLGLPVEDKVCSWTEILLAVHEQAGSSLSRHLRAVADSDLVAALAAAETTADELLNLVAMLVVGGAEVAGGFVANAMSALLDSPHRVALARNAPTMLPDLVADLVGSSDPLHVGAFRCTTAPIRLGDTVIPAGEVVMLAGAECPSDRRDIGTVGHGMQYRIGALLGRVLAETVLERLIGEFPRLRLAVPAGQIPWQFTRLSRAVESLPVEVR
ncbi:cytochrome P450 [Kutzneria sp. CA-103260]|uniref:cytochrome P450 n=1 Tax=Kutzneria sp. CA-103260 TaxID=2802641 RepID=UPI001BAB0785|nr:cytochrome P450 [Kutzneria sp. CA-103260]QUQ71927.1 cytochrome P450 [Kutzneria sp. CA-103260]